MGQKEDSVFIVRCPHFRGRKSGTWEKVSFLERCPQFRSVLIHCIDIVNVVWATMHLCFAGDDMCVCVY